MKGVSEQAIHIALVSYLRSVLPDGHLLVHARNEGNRGGKQGMMDGTRGKAMGVLPGWPDLLLYVGGEGYAIEVKRPGENLSPIQELVAEQLARQGIPHAVCRSIDDARHALASWGIKTKEKAA